MSSDEKQFSFFSRFLRHQKRALDTFWHCQVSGVNQLSPLKTRWIHPTQMLLFYTFSMHAVRITRSNFYSISVPLLYSQIPGPPHIHVKTHFPREIAWCELSVKRPLVACQFLLDLAQSRVEIWDLISGGWDGGEGCDGKGPTLRKGVLNNFLCEPSNRFLSGLR